MYQSQRQHQRWLLIRIWVLRAQGIYTGGLAHANELVASGRAAASEFKLLAGYAHWPTGQLQREMSGGAWWLVAASSDFILSSIRGAPHGVRHVGSRKGAGIDCNTDAGMGACS